MSDTNDPDTRSAPNADESGGFLPAAAESLRPLIERLQALQSAWRVLAPSCLSASGREIAAAGRDVREELSTLSKQPGGPDEADLERTRAHVDRLARLICGLAFKLPIPQLRATLPGCLRLDRRGLLDLLDLLADDAFGDAARFSAKLSAIDYLITLLCTGGNARARVAAHDPVLLTADFQAICQLAEQECDERLSEIEAEFFAAAEVESGLRDELQLRRLRARKAELGKTYFVPSMLRAIMTYNLAMLQCAAEEVWDTRDWCDDPEADLVQSDTSVFESDPLRSLHDAIRTRIESGPPDSSPIGRVAAALDLDYVSSSERSMLLGGQVPSPEGLRGTIVLVGLLCRSLNALSTELQSVGISPDGVSEGWVKELDELLKAEVNGCISGDAYQEACMVSELRNKYLYAPMVDVHRENRGANGRPRGVANASEERATRKEARGLASEALAQNGPTPAPQRGEATSWRDWPWKHIAPAGLSVAVALLVGLHMIGVSFLDGDLDRFSESELESISPYLVRGHRNGDGAGSAFVGLVDDEWLALGQEERRSVAKQLVGTLQRQGVTQVMIYDGEERLQIQALGKRVRIL